MVNYGKMLKKSTLGGKNGKANGLQLGAISEVLELQRDDNRVARGEMVGDKYGEAGVSPE